VQAFKESAEWALKLLKKEKMVSWIEIFNHYCQNKSR